MNRIELHRALDLLLNRLEAVESTAEALVAEYNRTYPYDRLCLYLQRDRRDGGVYGPYWGRLRKLRKRGRRITVKDHIGVRLSRREMYRCGMLNQKERLEEFDLRARTIREARNDAAGRVTKIRRCLKGIEGQG